MSKFASVCVVVLVTLVARPVHADPIIYDAGAPLLSNSFFADQNRQFTSAADSFVLQSGATTITDAHWWGNCNSGPCSNDEAFTISFFNNAAGQVGSLIQTYSVGFANQAATGRGNVNGQPEYSYSADFAPLTLAANTTYWFAVSNGQSGTPDWGWSPALTTGSHFQFNNSSGAWVAVPQELAFNLTGAPVPEPTSLLLFGTGALGVLARMRRRKQQ